MPLEVCWGSNRVEFNRLFVQVALAGCLATPVFAQHESPCPMSVKLEGTDRLPGAKGVASGTEIELKGMKPADLFGGDYSTYVLWTVSGEGEARNAGEFTLNGDRSKLKVPMNLCAQSV